MFAIVAISGSQYIVHPGDIIEVNQISEKPGETLTFPDVLLVHDEKKILVGKPKVKRWSVSAKILNHVKGEKMNVRRFKSKVRYRRSTGFRPHLTKLEIVKVSAS